MSREALSQLAELARVAVQSSGETGKVAAAILEILKGAEPTPIDRFLAEVNVDGMLVVGAHRLFAEYGGLSFECFVDGVTTRGIEIVRGDRSVGYMDCFKGTCGRLLPACNNPLDAQGQSVVYWAVPRISQELARQYLAKIPEPWKKLQTSHVPNTPGQLHYASNTSVGAPLVDNCISAVTLNGSGVVQNVDPASAVSNLSLYADDPSYVPVSREHCMVDVIKFITADGAKCYNCNTYKRAGCGNVISSGTICALPINVSLGYGNRFTLTKAPAFALGRIPPAERAYVCSWIDDNFIKLKQDHGMVKSAIYKEHANKCMVILTRENFDECMELMDFRSGVRGAAADRWYLVV